MPTLPTAKLPSWTIPTVRGLPTIPNVGCVSGSATTQVGNQFGNLPDLNALPHVKALQKLITEQIGTLLEGQQITAIRAPLYAVRQARLVTEMASMISTATSIASQVTADINATISGCNAKIADLNAAKNAILATPVQLRSTVQTKALGCYNAYIGEVNGQIGKLQTTLGCLT